MPRARRQSVMPIPHSVSQPTSLAVLIVVLLMTPACLANALNGTWTLDEAASDDVDEAGRAFNKELNELERERTKQKFDRDQRTRAGNKYDEQRLATEALIREDHRSRNWDIPEDVRTLVETPSLKLYQGRKVAILYGEAAKRLLTINPAGRAFSVSGTQITRDEFGRALTYVDGEAVVVETDLTSGDRLVERFETADGGSRLVYTVRFQLAARGPWLEFQRLFDRQQ